MRMTRRILLSILCLAVLTAVLPLAAQAEEAAEAPVITLSELSAKPGDDVTVAVDLADNPGMMGMTFDIRYDHDQLSLTGVSDAGLGGWSRKNDRILWLGTADSYENGTILNLSFHVEETARLGDVIVTLTYAPGDVSNHDLDDIFPRVEAGIVHIRAEDQEALAIRITELGEGRVSFALTAPEGADLIVACYDTGGRIIACILPPAGAESAALPEGTEHVKLFLVDGETFAPLCRAVKQ